jgi:hypothetical protein
MEGQRTEKFHQRTGKEPSVQGRLGWAQFIYIFRNAKIPQKILFSPKKV